VHGRPQEGARGSPDPPGFRHKFSHIITVAPRVEIQMHFWKGAKFACSVGHPMTKMLSASQPLTTSAAYDHPGKNPVGAPEYVWYNMLTFYR